MVRKDTDIILELNEKLKEIETYEEFLDFVKEMDSYGRGFMLYGKRRNYYAYGFSHMYTEAKLDGSPAFYAGNEEYKDRVRYVYSDSASTGESYVRNLYKVLRVFTPGL